MVKIDHFASTARGLFLAPGGLERDATEVAVLDDAPSSGRVAAVEVREVPPGCAVDGLEVVEPLAGTRDSWLTREVPLRPGMKLAVALAGRFANRSISGHEPSGPCPPGSEVVLLNKGGISGFCDDPAAPVVRLAILGSIERGGKPAALPDMTLVSGISPSTGGEGAPETPIVLLTGSDMEVGKTTCAACLAASLRAAGIRSSYAKLTGTGRMRDLMRVAYGRPLGRFDAARAGWDFVDAGLASTADRPEGEVLRCARLLLRHAARQGEIVLAELADSPCADGSLHVAADPWLQKWLKARGVVIFACDSVESSLMLHWMRSHMDLDPENILVSGRVANDPDLRRQIERMAGVKAASCLSPGGYAAGGRNCAGGALGEWVIRHIMAHRRASA